MMMCDVPAYRSESVIPASLASAYRTRARPWTVARPDLNTATGVRIGVGDAYTGASPFIACLFVVLTSRFDRLLSSTSFKAICHCILSDVGTGVVTKIETDTTHV